MCVLVCMLPSYPATPGWGVRRECVCLGSGFGCAPPLLAGVVGSVCACVGAPLVPRHSWLGCGARVCVLGLGFWLRPATPGWGVGLCVCWCSRSAYTLPLLAGVCGVGGCAWVQVSAAPRHSWLGCLGVCVLLWALPLYPATPGWGVRRGCVCLGSGFGCAPPLLAGVLGCACWCACSPCTPPLLAGVCDVGVCAWVRVSAAPCHSWLGCWGACVLLCALRLLPATPGWGVRCRCVCFGSGFQLRPASPGWAVGVCVCLCACSACTPPLLAGVCGVGVCAWARVLAAPRHSWLGCWGVCVLVFALRLYPAIPGWGVRRVCVFFWLGFQLRPATPGWGFWVCVCWCACSSCTPPLLAGVCVVGVCARALVLAPPRHSWLGCVVCGLAVAWHLSLCRGSLCVVRAARVCGTRWPLLLCTCPRAVVVAGGVPLWHASWPRVGAPRLFRSGRSRCSGRFSCCRGAFPHPGGLRPRLYWVAARGTRRPAENRAPCFCRWPPPRRGRWAHSASYPSGAPRWGCPWRVPPASVLGCVRCGGWRVWTRSLTRPASRTARGCFLWTPTPPLSGRRAPRPGSARVSVCVPFSPFLWRLLVRSLFARPPPGLGCPVCGCCWGFCFPSPSLLRPRRFLLSVFSGSGCLGPWRLVARPPPFFFLPCFSFGLLCFFLLAPAVSGVSCFLASAALGLRSSFSPRPPPLFFIPPPLPVFFFTFFLLLLCSLVFYRLCGAWPVCVFWALGCVGVRFGGAVPAVALGAVLSRPSGVGWCCVVSPAVFGCLLLGLAVLCCLLVGLGVVFRWCCPCLAAWLAGLWVGVVCLGVLLPCVVFCSAVLSCGGVLSCSALCLRRCLRLVVPPPPFLFGFFVSSPLPVGCFFFLLFVCSLVFCRLCGAGPVSVSRAVGCAGVCFGGAVLVVALCAVLARPSGVGWCCVVLPVVFGCLLLGLAVLCCFLVGLGVVFRWCRPRLAAWLAALWFGVVCLGVLLPCVEF